MKQIKLNGRERSVLRVLDMSCGNTGEELLERARLDPDDLINVLNGLISPGYMEVVPYSEETTVETFMASHFDINPSYASDLRDAMTRR